MRGTLTTASNLIAGTAWGRVRQMTDSSGKVLQSAGPGTPVTVSGWKEVPDAGDEVLVAEEDKVKMALTNRLRMKERNDMKADVEKINEKRKGVREGEVDGVQEQDGAEAVKELKLIIKADVSGTAEAVVGALEGIGNKIARVKIVQSGVGDVSDSDVAMAKAIGGTSLDRLSTFCLNLYRRSRYDCRLLCESAIEGAIDCLPARRFGPHRVCHL